MKARSGPDSLVDSNDLLECLRSFDKDELAEILWIRAQHDDLLQRALTATVVIQACAGDFEKGRAAIDFGLHLPDFVSYNEEDGYGQLLDGINRGVRYLADHHYGECAAKIAQYAVERAEAVLERFEEGWDWRCAIDRLSELVEKLKAEVPPDGAA